MLKLFPSVFALALALPAAAQIPTPQVGLTGTAGALGDFPLLNAGTFAMPADADYVVGYPNTTCISCTVTSSVALTGPRSLVMPTGMYYLIDVCNYTTGGQGLTVRTTSGSASPAIANGSCGWVRFDGTNYVSATSSGAGGGSAGATGPQGIQGVAGATGPQGPAGPMGATGANGVAGGVASGSVLHLIDAQRNNSANVFNAAASVPGSLNADGTVGAVNGRIVSDFIPVAAGDVMSTNANLMYGGYAWYDVNKVFLNASSSTPAVAPADGYYRETLDAGLTNTAMITRNGTLPSTYQSFGYLDSASIAGWIAASATTVNNTVVTTAIHLIDSQRSNAANVFDQTAVTIGRIHTADGTVSPGGDHSVTDFIPVAVGDVITSNVRSDDGGYVWYDVNKSFLGGSNGVAAGTPVTAAATGFYRQCQNSGNDPTMVIVRNGTVPANYVSFGYDDAATSAAKIQAAITSSNSSPVRVGVVGDSITDLFEPEWAMNTIARLGMTLTFANALGGEGTRNAFQDYGGDGTGAFTGHPSGHFSIGSVAGDTLSQDLAKVDLLVIWLSTNDGGLYPNNLGNAGDTPSNTASNFSANVGWQIQTAQNANPAMRIVWISAYQDDPSNGHGGCNSAACVQAIKTALIAECSLFGVDVLDMAAKSGINSSNWSTTLFDGLHPSSIGWSNFIDPAIRKFLEGYK